MAPTICSDKKHRKVRSSPKDLRMKTKATATPTEQTLAAAAAAATAAAAAVAHLNGLTPSPRHSYVNTGSLNSPRASQHSGSSNNNNSIRSVTSSPRHSGSATPAGLPRFSDERMEEAAGITPHASAGQRRSPLALLESGSEDSGCCGSGGGGAAAHQRRRWKGFAGDSTTGGEEDDCASASVLMGPAGKRGAASGAFGCDSSSWEDSEDAAACSDIAIDCSAHARGGAFKPHRNTEGLLAIAMKTIKLVKRNRLLQQRLSQLQLETAEFIRSVLANPENRHFRDKMQRAGDAAAVANI